jgi:hypothetical protein
MQRGFSYDIVALILGLGMLVVSFASDRVFVALALLAMCAIFTSSSRMIKFEDNGDSYYIDDLNFRQEKIKKASWIQKGKIVMATIEVESPTPKAKAISFSMANLDEKILQRLISES